MFNCIAFNISPNISHFPILIWQQWTKYWTKVLTALSQTILCVLDNLEVLAEVTEQTRFLPWEFVTIYNLGLREIEGLA